jgi:hypothetical protein
MKKLLTLALCLVWLHVSAQTNFITQTNNSGTRMNVVPTTTAFWRSILMLESENLFFQFLGLTNDAAGTVYFPPSPTSPIGTNLLGRFVTQILSANTNITITLVTNSQGQVQVTLTGGAGGGTVNNFFTNNFTNSSAFTNNFTNNITNTVGGNGTNISYTWLTFPSATNALPLNNSFWRLATTTSCSVTNLTGAGAFSTLKITNAAAVGITLTIVPGHAGINSTNALSIPAGKEGIVSFSFDGSDTIYTTTTFQ